MNQTVDSTLDQWATERARATVVRYIDIVLINNAIRPVREDLIKNEGAGVIYELIDILVDLFPDFTKDEDENWAIANEALIILKTILIK